MRRRRVHQHRAALALDDAEIAAEGRVAGKRQDLVPRPTRGGKEFRRMGGGIIAEAIAPPMTGAPSLSRFSSPFGAKSSDRRSASGHASAPARSGHSTSSTASAGSVRAEFLELRRILDPVQIDVPHRRDRDPHRAGRSRSSGSALRPRARARREIRAPASSCRPRAGPTA